jgi:hypothetical protein
MLPINIKIKWEISGKFFIFHPRLMVKHKDKDKSWTMTALNRKTEV